MVISFNNQINEQIYDVIIQLMTDLELNPISGVIETVPAYNSLTVFYDVLKIRKDIIPKGTAFSKITNEIEKRIPSLIIQKPVEKKAKRIPVCYHPAFGFDLERVADIHKISPQDVIQYHISRKYRVYMTGFLPGFAYMGETYEKIYTPRKDRPMAVPAGSVGIAGNQTGIYPFDSPGGWQIIGRTPVKMFIPDKDPPVYLQAGDMVQFYSITHDEFENYQSGNSR